MGIRKLTDEQIAEACRRYEQGEKVESIAERLGVRHGCISKHAKKAGLTLHRHRKVNTPAIYTICLSRVRIDPPTWEEIKETAARAGISASEQTRLLITWGLEAANGH